MKKVEIIFDTAIPKKHSVRYDTSQPKPAVSSIYISRQAFDTPPKKVKVTIEEVE